MQKILWSTSAIINLGAIIMSVEIGPFDWLSYVNLACLAAACYFVGAAS